VSNFQVSDGYVACVICVEMVLTPVAEHALNLYNAMLEQSVDGVFEGSLIQVYDSTVSSRAFYSKIMQGLQHSGSITLLQRGSKNQPSRVALNYPPEDVENFQPRGLTRQGDLATIRQRIKDLENQTGGIHIGQAIGELEQRVTKLEEKYNG
jgi:hypothetical protein